MIEDIVNIRIKVQFQRADRKMTSRFLFLLFNVVFVRREIKKRRIDRSINEPRQTIDFSPDRSEEKSIWWTHRWSKLFSGLVRHVFICRLCSKTKFKVFLVKEQTFRGEFLIDAFCFLSFVARPKTSNEKIAVGQRSRVSSSSTTKISTGATTMSSGRNSRKLESFLFVFFTKMKIKKRSSVVESTIAFVFGHSAASFFFGR